jgi:hypothetical protein
MYATETDIEIVHELPAGRAEVSAVGRRAFCNEPTVHSGALSVPGSIVSRIAWPCHRRADRMAAFLAYVTLFCHRAVSHGQPRQPNQRAPQLETSPKT